MLHNTFLTICRPVREQWCCSWWWIRFVRIQRRRRTSFKRRNLAQCFILVEISTQTSDGMCRKTQRRKTSGVGAIVESPDDVAGLKVGGHGVGHGWIPELVNTIHEPDTSDHELCHCVDCPRSGTPPCSSQQWLPSLPPCAPGQHRTVHRCWNRQDQVLWW